MGWELADESAGHLHHEGSYTGGDGRQCVHGAGPAHHPAGHLQRGGDRPGNPPSRFARGPAGHGRAGFPAVRAAPGAGHHRRPAVAAPDGAGRGVAGDPLPAPGGGDLRDPGAADDRFPVSLHGRRRRFLERVAERVFGPDHGSFRDHRGRAQHHGGEDCALDGRRAGSCLVPAADPGAVPGAQLAGGALPSGRFRPGVQGAAAGLLAADPGAGAAAQRHAVGKAGFPGAGRPGGHGRFLPPGCGGGAWPGGPPESGVGLVDWFLSFVGHRHAGQFHAGLRCRLRRWPGEFPGQGPGP